MIMHRLSQNIVDVKISKTYLMTEWNNSVGGTQEKDGTENILENATAVLSHFFSKFKDWDGLRETNSAGLITSILMNPLPQIRDSQTRMRISLI